MTPGVPAAAKHGVVRQLLAETATSRQPLVAGQQHVQSPRSVRSNLKGLLNIGGS